MEFTPEPWKSLVGTPAQLVERVGAFEREGTQHLLLEFYRNDSESYELFVDEVMAAFR